MLCVGHPPMRFDDAGDGGGVPTQWSHHIARGLGSLNVAIRTAQNATTHPTVILRRPPPHRIITHLISTQHLHDLCVVHSIQQEPLRAAYAVAVNERLIPISLLSIDVRSAMSASSSMPPPSTTPLPVSDYRDLLLNLKAQNATDLVSLPSSPLSPPSSSPPSSSPVLTSSGEPPSLDPAPSAGRPRGPVSALASKSFAEKKARLAAQAQQFKTLPTKRLHPVPGPGAVTAQLAASDAAATSQSGYASSSSTSRTLSTGPLSPTRAARPSAGFSFTPGAAASSSTSSSSSPTSAAAAAYNGSFETPGAGPKSRSGIFGSHLPPISTESQRIGPPSHPSTGGVGTASSLGSVLSPSSQQASAPIASTTSRTRTGSAVSPRGSDPSAPLPAQSPPSGRGPSSPPPAASSHLVLPSPRRASKPIGNLSAAFSPSLQARLASQSQSNQQLVSPRRRTADTSPSPRDPASAVESLQAEFDKLSAEWNEQKMSAGVGEGAGGGGGLNASFSYGLSGRRAAAAYTGSADDSALSHRRQRVLQSQTFTLPTSPSRRLVERVHSFEEEAGSGPPPAHPHHPHYVFSSSAPTLPPPTGYVLSRAPLAVAPSLNSSSVEAIPREHEVGLLADPFAYGGEGLLDDAELNL